MTRSRGILLGLALVAAAVVAYLIFASSDAPDQPASMPAHPSSMPSSRPSSQPSSMPASQPSSMPSSQPSSMPAASGEIAHYTCAMHPSVKQATPGACPICGMDLVPVTRDEVASGTLFVDSIRRQQIGVKTAPVERRRLVRSVRAAGTVTWDETQLHDVNLRMTGWVQGLRVDETGQQVRRGQTLFGLYSPELYAAQGEHLSALARKGGVPSLIRASHRRLGLLGLDDKQIATLEKQDAPQEVLAIRSPASGYIVEKNVVEGAQVTAGTRVYRIGALDTVWVDASVYESDLPHIRVGQTATVALPNVPRSARTGRVDFIHPQLDRETRTGRVRVALSNPDLAMKPGMFADVTIAVDLGERVVIPDSAVVYTGPRRLVFVDIGEGRLRPKIIEVGAHIDGWYEVLEGLEVGDVVVSSGNFLIAAESRIRSATQYWEATDEAE